jgi:hypothetical protein
MSAAFRTVPARLFAGISIPPIVANRVAGARQPFLVASQLFQYFCGEELRAVAWWMSKRLQQARRDQHGNLMRLKAEKPGGLGGAETGRGNFPTQKLGLLCHLVHTAIYRDYGYHGSSSGRCIIYTKNNDGTSAATLSHFVV